MIDFTISDWTVEAEDGVVAYVASVRVSEHGKHVGCLAKINQKELKVQQTGALVQLVSDKIQEAAQALLSALRHDRQLPESVSDGARN